MHLRGGYEEKLFKIILCEFDVRNTLENIIIQQQDRDDNIMCD